MLIIVAVSSEKFLLASLSLLQLSTLDSFVFCSPSCSLQASDWGHNCCDSTTVDFVEPPQILACLRRIYRVTSFPPQEWHKQGTRSVWRAHCFISRIYLVTYRHSYFIGGKLNELEGSLIIQLRSLQWQCLYHSRARWLPLLQQQPTQGSPPPVITSTDGKEKRYTAV